MSMASEGKRNRCCGRGIEGVRMMRQKDRKTFWLTLVEELAYCRGNRDIPVFSRSRPTEAKYLQRRATDSDHDRFVEEKLNPRMFHPTFELGAVLDQVMITFDQINAVNGLHGSNEIESVINIHESVINQVAGKKNEIGA